jgi:hypothetical protein
MIVLFKTVYATIYKYPYIVATPLGCIAGAIIEAIFFK